jgi:hypothetical protein
MEFQVREGISENNCFNSRYKWLDRKWWDRFGLLNNHTKSFKNDTKEGSSNNYFLANWLLS